MEQEEDAGERRGEPAAPEVDYTKVRYWRYLTTKEPVAFNIIEYDGFNMWVRTVGTVWSRDDAETICGLYPPPIF